MRITLPATTAAGHGEAGANAARAIAPSGAPQERDRRHPPALLLEREAELDHAESGTAGRLGDGDADHSRRGQRLPQAAVDAVGGPLDLLDPLGRGQVGEHPRRDPGHRLLLLGEGEVHYRPAGGLNLRILQRWVPTSSPCWSWKRILLVRKWPDPSAVCFSSRHVLDHRRQREPVARAQLAEVLLLAVGGDDRREAVRVEQCEQLAVLVARIRRRAAEAVHDPRLDHRRRGDQAAVDRCRRGVGVVVHDELVADRLAPVADHRLVDGVGSGEGRPGLDPLERLQLGEEVTHVRCGHRGWRAMCSPAAATMSRCTSLTPPPKVLICAARAARSSWPRSTAPGDPSRR